MKSQQGRNKQLAQWFTPEWAARELFDFFMPNACSADVVLEPSCGTGMFLKAVPSHVPAFGVEIDAALAAEAVLNTGRQVIVGDFLSVDLPFQPTCIIGNPPYRVALFNQFLSRAKDLLPTGGRCGFLLSAHMLQTPGTVLEWNRDWSLEQQLVPRTLFPRAIRPLVFVSLCKNTCRRMNGFLLYRQSADVASMQTGARRALVEGEPRKCCWRTLVEWAVRRLGGRAALQDIYREIAPHRPQTNQWWQEKVRQILQTHFTPIERGVWELAA